MISFISSFEIINVIPNANIFLWIVASVANAAANPNHYKTLWGNGLSTFLIKGKPVFSNEPKSLLKNSPDCPVYAIEVFMILY